jgi:DNA-binding NtrC family response regulator
VVDSDPDCRDLVRDTLVAAGCSVRVAETGDAALAVLQEAPVDLVFTASSLPGTTGLALLDAIRRLADRPEVIFITTYDTIDSAVKAVKWARSAT